MKPENKEAAVKAAYDKALASVSEYGSCAQMIVLVVQDILETRDDNLFKAVSGLTGGVGGMGNICGAMLALSLLVSLKYGRGRDELDNKNKLEESVNITGAMYMWFESEFGSVNCKELCSRAVNCRELIAKTAAQAVDVLWDTYD